MIEKALQILLASSLAQAAPLPEPPQEQMLCPAPRTIILVRCPGPHEITTMTVSCMVKRKIDECALVAQGEGK